jgi:hypothetical protein
MYASQTIQMVANAVRKGSISPCRKRETCAVQAAPRSKKKGGEQTMTKEEILSDRLRHATFAYLNEEAARKIARLDFADFEIVILHSPHQANPSVKGYRMDYWIDEPGLVRSWETVLYQGEGKNA